MHINKRKKPIWKAISCIIPTRWCFWKSKTLETVNRSTLAWDWGDERAKHRRCLRQWNSFIWYNHDGYMSWYIYSNPWYVNTKNEPQCKPQTSVMIIYQCRFINRDKYTLWWGVNSGEILCVEDSGHMENLCTSSQFCCDTNALRIKP